MSIAPANIKGAFYLLELTGQDISVVMRILLQLKLSCQISQMLYIMHKGNSFSSKTLAKSLFHFTK